MRIPAGIFFLLFSITTNAQLGSWNIINIKANINDKWSLFGEAQLRSLRFYNDFHYYEYKGGVGYNLSNNFSLVGGLGNYDTYAEGGNFKTPMVNDEFRTWLQLSMKQSLNRFKFEHRYRAEQRWTINGFRNRFRYRLQTVMPVNKKKLEKGTFYLAVWDELFFTNRAPYFERNRFFAGGGYEVNDQLAVQTGFLNQFDYRLNDETGRNFFQISFLYELALRKKKQEHIPGGVD
jgi:long-subunit fatty acid transport protein